MSLQTRSTSLQRECQPTATSSIVLTPGGFAIGEPQDAANFLRAGPARLNCLYRSRPTCDHSCLNSQLLQVSRIAADQDRPPQLGRLGMQHLRQDQPASVTGALALLTPVGQAKLADIQSQRICRIGSRTRAITELPHQTFIVGTDRGLFHKLRQQNPNKRFIEAPTAGDGATCRSCAHCPWMAMNELSVLADLLRDDERMAANEIHVDPEIGERAMLPLTRMLDFQAAR